MEIPTYPTPTAPPHGVDSGVLRKWEKSIDGIIKREDILKVNTKTLFSLIWGQCTEVLHAKIEAVPGFEDVSHEADSLKLLVLLKKETYNFQSQKNPVQAKHKAMWYFYHLMQEKHSSHKALRDRFNKCVDVIEHCGGTIVDCKDVEGELSDLSLTFQTATTEQITQAKQSAKDKLLGVAYLMCVDWSQFGKLLKILNMLTMLVLTSSQNL